MASNEDFEDFEDVKTNIRSPIWEYFTWIKDVDDGEIYGLRKSCKHLRFKCSSGSTSTLQNHLRNDHTRKSQVLEVNLSNLKKKKNYN